MPSEIDTNRRKRATSVFDALKIKADTKATKAAAAETENGAIP